jgi:hypothetical protein
MTARIIIMSFVLLPLAGCSLGTEGELGRGEFVYVCSTGTDDVECLTAGEERSIPSAVAVGAPLSIRYDADGGDIHPVTGASHRHVQAGGGGLVVAVAGPAGILALDVRGGVYDLVHVISHEVASLELLCHGGLLGGAGECDAPMQLEPGDEAMIEAMPLSAWGEALGGRLTYSWEIGDASIASFDSYGGQRIVEIRGESPGTTALLVSAGGVTSQIEIVVAGGADADTDTDSDSDADTDADTDADSDTDVDSDADVDAGADAGGDAGGE